MSVLLEGPAARAADERCDAAVLAPRAWHGERPSRGWTIAPGEEARAILRDARWDPLAPGRALLAHGRMRAICRRRSPARAPCRAVGLQALAQGVGRCGCRRGRRRHRCPGFRPRAGARMDPGLVVALSVIGAGAGALGAAGWRRSATATLARSARAFALTVAGGIGGGIARCTPPPSRSCIRVRARCPRRRHRRG